jgi:hypothetical protein
VRSRPDRQPEIGDRRARGAEAQRARDAFVPTPAFTLVAEQPNIHEVTLLPSTPNLRAMPSPRATAVNKYWFNPSWIAENEHPEVYHGEFQSPVWLAVEMTMRSDRERDRVREDYEFGAPLHARHAEAVPGTGQLRSMLAFVSGAKHAVASPITPVTFIHPELVGDKPSASSRYHDLHQRPARPVRKFARFISSNFGKVSVNHN